MLKPALVSLVLLLACGGARADTAKDCSEGADWDVKLSACTSLIGQGRGLSWHYNERGRAYSAKGDTARALADYNKSIELDPKNSAAYDNRGILAYEKGDYDGAIADYNKAIELDPNNAVAYDNRALSYEGKKDRDRALADYNKAIEIDPKFVLAYTNRGALHSDKGDYDRAIADFNKALDINPNFASAYNNRGDAYNRKEDTDRAIADFTRAIEINPNKILGYTNRGLVYGKRGDFDRAIADYNKAIEIDPRNGRAYSFRVWVRLRANRDLPLALADADSAIRLQPNDVGGPLTTRGFVYLRLDRFDEAIADFDAALTAKAKLSSALYGRGLAKRAKGDQAGSDADIAAAKEINPEVADTYAKYGIK